MRHIYQQKPSKNVFIYETKEEKEMLKVCSKCQIEHDTKNKGTICKACKSSQDKLYKEDNKEKIALRDKHYREQNKEKIKEKTKVYRINNKEILALKKKIWASQNIESCERSKKGFFLKNLELCRQRANEHYQINKDKIIRKHLLKLKTDLNYKIKANMRIRLYQIIKNKKGKTLELLGIDFETFKLHLEKLFKPNMTWENYGLKGWTIDHIKPLTSFDLTNKSQLKQACHYTNLQPLWFHENSSKGDRI